MGKRISDAERLAVVQTFLALGGNIKRTADACRITHPAILLWKKQDWWHETIEELQKQERLELSARLKGIVEKSWDTVANRLEVGDAVLNQKSGEIVYKPVSLRDAANVAKDATQLREKLDQQAAFTVHTDQVEDKLAKLAQAFTDLAKGKLSTGPVEDIQFLETTNAVDDKWETRLQEGEQIVQQSAGAKEKA